MFHTSRTAVSSDHRVACEGAFEPAGFITTKDITILQAFVLYPVSKLIISYKSLLINDELHAMADVYLIYKDCHWHAGLELWCLNLGICCCQDCSSAFPTHG